jgi:prolyl 4-hydroxylase
MLHIEARCPLDPEAVDALQPGDVNRLFQKIAYSPEYQQYEPVVVSKPPEGPWMLMFENALSEAEAERLIELGGIQGYERSADVGIEKTDGTHEKKVNNGRTSTNAWCIGECMDDPVAQTVMARIENITGIPEPNSENLQLLRYEEDQFYQVHSDYIPYHTERPCGVRILTFYMYLNDVEEGGGTNFPNANNVTVTPKRGRAVLWPSVLDEDPHRKDYRTNHQALPVIKGVKYGANAWIHQRDFKAANTMGCN